MLTNCCEAFNLRSIILEEAGLILFFGGWLLFIKTVKDPISRTNDKVKQEKTTAATF